MNAAELQDALQNLIEAADTAREEAAQEDPDLTALADLALSLADEIPQPVTARGFDREQMLTTDAGLVLRLADGSEFQITIVQSRQGRR